MATNKKENNEIAPTDVVGSDAALLEENVSSLYKHKLSRSIEYEGVTYEELSFDFDSLTGGDSLDIENEIAAKGRLLIVKTSDAEYLSRMCARACVQKVDVGIFRVMPVKDYNRIMNTAKRFL